MTFPFPIIGAGQGRITLEGVTTHVLPASTNQTISLPATMREGDLVLAIACTDAAGVFVAPTGYTNFYSNSGNPYSAAYYKVMGSTPDTSITLNYFSTSTKTTYIVAVFRNVDVVSGPFDAATTSAANATETATIALASITTVTDNAVVVSMGFLDDDDITSCTQTGGNDVTFISAGDVTNSDTTMFSWQYKETAGAITPNNFNHNGFDQSNSATAALKPR